MTTLLIVSSQICVVNLVPESKSRQFSWKIGRLHKAGGRVAISDILARTEMPAHIKDSVALQVGCIAVARTKDAYTQFLSRAGFKSNRHSIL
jgi:arsenite methyltransferase